MPLPKIDPESSAGEWVSSTRPPTLVGVIVTGVAHWLRVWIIEKKGPVFVATFTPLALIITVIFSSIFWKESFYWGRLIFYLLQIICIYSWFSSLFIYLFIFVCLCFHIIFHFSFLCETV
ncbi:hypothetical protein HYC85_008064 [Camellia sinensis]|uniref:WAT1-related protein n=1 Tax=Camellia sinensis TaxID=4442 RepID=A0A7J7HT72_CAMSI|nr:hypothetical protein HYC85_008064 [Camellia sinensis]